MQLTARDGLALASASLAEAALGAAAWFLLTGPGAPGAAGLEIAAAGSPGGTPAAGVPAGSGQPTPGGELVVDVQGAVARPGLVRLAPGSRVADAIAAAGGYSDAADLLAAAAAINLAAPLADGEQVFVPIRGVASLPGGGADPGSGGSGLVNLNTASPEALEALPGIGPVTVQKIVAARQERPFTTLEELVERKVMNNGQLEGIRALVTV